MSRKWYRFETGNEKRKNDLIRFLRRNHATFEVADGKRRCDWWIVRVLIMDRQQLEDVNRFLAAT